MSFIDANFKFRIEGAREAPSGDSRVWGKFQEVVHRRTGVPLAVCMYCSRAYTHPWSFKSKPTRSLSRHLQDCIRFHRTQQVSNQPPSIANFFNQSQSSHLQPITKSQIEEQVLKFLISASIPFRQADNEYFRELVSWITVNNAPAKPPSRKVIRSRLTKEAVLAKENLKNILSTNCSKISLALDCWTTRTNFGFLGTNSIR